MILDYISLYKTVKKTYSDRDLWYSKMQECFTETESMKQSIGSVYYQSDVDKIIDKFLTRRNVVLSHINLPEELEGAMYFSADIRGNRNIVMIKKEAFKNESEYYACLFHEIYHCIRTFNTPISELIRLNDNIENIINEEIEAEIASVYLMKYFGIKKRARELSKIYLSLWSSHLAKACGPTKEMTRRDFKNRVMAVEKRVKYITEIT